MENIEYTYLFLSSIGFLGGIAKIIKDEGYPVKFWLGSEGGEDHAESMKGIFDKNDFTQDPFEVIVKTPREKLIIVTDDCIMQGSTYGYIFDFLKKNEYMVIGGGSFNSKIEHKRSVGNDLFKDLGFETPETNVFTSLTEGEGFLKAQSEDARFVFKGEGLEFAGSSKTYTGKNRDDLLQFMEWLKDDSKMKHYDIDKFELQEFIEGYEADFSAYFDGEKFMKGSCNLYIEEKKSGDGNLGFATGCMGCVTAYLPQSRYLDKYIEKLTPYFKRVGFVGQVGINNIFAKSDGQPRPLEFTPRFGWDSLPVECKLIKDAGLRVCDFLNAIALKKDFPFPHNLVGAGVRVYCEGPHVVTKEIDNRLFTFDDKLRDNFYFYNVEYNRDKDYYKVVENPVLVATGTGGTYQEALNVIYKKTLPKLFLSDIYYRMEIGKRFPEVVRSLKKYGWI